MLSSLILLVFLSPAQGEEADLRLLPVRGVGLEAATLEAARGRVRGELKLMGLSIAETAQAPPAACLEQPSCAGELSGPTAGVIDVEVVRFGPDLTITARFFDRTGALKAVAERSVTSEGFQLSGTLLGPDFANALRESVDAAPDPLLAVEPRAAPPESDTDVAAQPAPDESEGLSPIALALLAGGGGLSALGAVGLLGGTLAFAAAYATLFDPSSSGSAKATMEPVRWVGAGVGVGGVVVLMVGLAVAASSSALF